MTEPLPKKLVRDPSLIDRIASEVREFLSVDAQNHDICHVSGHSDRGSCPCLTSAERLVLQKGLMTLTDAADFAKLADEFFKSRDPHVFRKTDRLAGGAGG